MKEKNWCLRKKSNAATPLWERTQEKWLFDQYDRIREIHTDEVYVKKKINIL